MRATVHNARKGKNGTFSAKHNDRNFDTGNAEQDAQDARESVQKAQKRVLECRQGKIPLMSVSALKRQI